MTDATMQARLPADLVLMLSQIAKCEGSTVAEIADPILRPRVERLADKLPEPDRSYLFARLAKLTAEPTPAAAAK